MKKILYSSLLLSILQSILFWHKGPGISVILFIIPTVLLILYNLKERQMINNKKGILWLIPIILLSLTYFIFNNAFFQILNIPIIFALIILMCISLTEKITENRFIRNIIKKAFMPLYEIIEFIGDFHIEEFIEENKDIKSKKIEFAKKLGKSMLIAIPVIIIIIILLSSADSIFGSLFTNISKLISNILSSESISDIIARIIWIIIIFAYISGFLITFTKKEKEEENPSAKKFNFSNFTINTLLISLDVIYFIFSIIQFKYLFINAGRTEGFNYAEYARTGFFQLMFVSFINFGLIKISKNTQTERLNKILKILLVIFTMIIVISAIFRMYLYEQEYGYTYLRILVYFILATEILILIPILINIAGKEFNIFETSLSIIITMYVILNFINIDYVISKNNIDRYLADPENNNIDIYYILIHTGTDSINELVRLVQEDERELSYERKQYMENVKSNVKRHLSTTYEFYNEIKDESKWQEWNLSESNAYKVLKNLDLKEDF